MQRIEILLEANVIQADTYELVNKVIQLMKETYLISEVQMEMMITHLAMATERIRNGSIVEEMDDEIYATIVANENFTIAQEVMSEIVKLAKVEYPHSEQQFMLLHLCNSMKGEDVDA